MIPLCPHLQRRGSAPGQPVLRPPVPGRRADAVRPGRPRAHRPGPPRAAPQARGRVPRRRAEAAVLLADDGARRRHRRPQRRRHAQRPADARQLRAALRPRRPVRPARPGHHLLRHRQQPRPVLLPQLRQDGLRRRHPAAPRPAQRGPAPLPRPRDLARRDRRPPGPGDPRVHRHGRHRAGGQAAARPAPRAHRRGRRATSTTSSAIDRAVTRATAVLDELDRRPARPGPPGGTRAGSSAWSRAAPATFDRAFDRWRDLFRAALVDQWEQNRRRLDYSLSQRDRDIAGRRRTRGRDPAAPAAQRGQRRPQPHRRLQPLPLPRLRGVPARLLVPAAADRRLHPARPAAARRRRLRAAGQVPGDQGVRPARADLPRGQPVRGQPRPAPAGRVGRACHPPGAPLPRLRLLLRRRARQRPLRARARARSPRRVTGLFPLHTVFTRPLQRITSDEEERRRAGFRIVTSYRFQDHGDRPGRLDAIVSDAAARASRAWPTATPRKSTGSTSAPSAGPRGRPTASGWTRSPAPG